MKQLHRSMLAVLFAALVTGTLVAQSAEQLRTERVNASYLIAMGRKPNSGELKHWTAQGNLSIAQMVEYHRQYLSGDANMKKAMIIKAFKNSYGRTPTTSEVNTNMRQNMTYTEWMNNHYAWLKKSSTDYTDVIKRAYKAVMYRDPSNAELNHFKSQPVMSYMILAASLEEWKRKNGNAAKTSGSNVVGTSSGYVDQVKVSNTVANEANKLIGTAAGNVIAPGGGNVISAGGGNVIAAGGGN